MVRTRLLVWISCGLCIFSMCSEMAMGQQRGGGNRGPQIRARYELATLTEVQTDLKLNDDQKQLAKDLLAKQREKRQSFTQGGDPSYALDERIEIAGSYCFDSKRFAGVR
jgi:hypothetical protein